MDDYPRKELCGIPLFKNGQKYGQTKYKADQHLKFLFIVLNTGHAPGSDKQAGLVINARR